MRQYFSGLVLAASFIFIVLAADVFGADYRSEKGYSITYPDDWRLASQDDRKSMEEAAKKMAGNADLSKLDVVIYDTKAVSNSNVNVVVVEQGGEKLPSVREMKSALATQLGAAGKVSDLQCNKESVNGYDAIVSTWHLEMPFMIGTLDFKQKQVIIAGDKYGYIITCTAPTASYDDKVSEFNIILNGFQPDGNPKSGLLSNLPGWAIGAIVGGLIGAIYYVVAPKKKSA